MPLRGNIYFAAAGVARRPALEPLVSESMDDHQETAVGELADRGLYALAPQDTFRTLLKVLMHSPQEIFPVLDGEGRLVGIIRERNLRPFLLDKKLYDILVADDFMGSAPPSLPADTTLAEATRVFDTTGADGVCIQWGSAPDKLYHSCLTYVPGMRRITALCEGQRVWLRVDAFNGSGITCGEVQEVLE